MSRLPPPIVLLHLPNVAGRDTLRSGLMAMQGVPENLPIDASQRYARLQSISQSARVFCAIDISTGDWPDFGGFRSVVTQVPTWLRTHTLLTRLTMGHVSAAERVWVKSLGFADLLPEFDAGDPEGNLRIALDIAAQSLALPVLAPGDLARYVRAGRTTSEPNVARALIRDHTGLGAEQLTVRLADLLIIEDRTYHLRNYAQCFIASEAIGKITREFKLLPEQAVALGQALGALGLLFHVEQKHSFSNRDLFFRLAHLSASNDVDLGQALDVLHRNLAVADRNYLGTTYRQCWVGSEAVDLLCARFSLPRHESHLALHRLMQFGEFSHVVSQQPFIDGNFFYTFVAS